MPLAAAGAIYPVAFAVIVGLLGGVDPLRRSVAFLAGGAAASLVGFVVIIFVLQSLHLTPRTHPVASGIIKISLGAILLALAVRTVWRHNRFASDRDRAVDATAPTEETQDRSLWRTFLTGAIVYFPGVFLIASAKAIADAHAGTVQTYATVVVCVVLLLLVVELPIVAYAISADHVRPALIRIIDWSHAHSYALVLAIECVGGLYLAVTGVNALASA